MYGEYNWPEKIMLSVIALMAIGAVLLTIYAITTPDTRPVECINGYKYHIGSHGEMYIIKDKYGPRKCK